MWHLGFPSGHWQSQIDYRSIAWRQCNAVIQHQYEQIWTLYWLQASSCESMILPRLQSFFVDYLWLPFPSLEQNVDFFFPHPFVSSNFYRQGHFMIPQSGNVAGTFARAVVKLFNIWSDKKKIYRLPERLAGEVTFWWFIGPWTLTVSHGNILEISTKEKCWFSMQTKGRLLWTLHKTSSGIVFCWCDVGYVKATCCSVDSRATDGHGFWQDLLRKWNLGAAIRGGGYQGAVLMSICHGNHPTWASQNG